MARVTQAQLQRLNAQASIERLVRGRGSGAAVPLWKEARRRGSASVPAARLSEPRGETA